MPKPKNPSYRELKRAAEEHPAPWRVQTIRGTEGFRKYVYFYILDAKERDVMQVESPELARRIVAAINEREAK